MASCLLPRLHHGHVPEGHRLRWTGRQRGDCVFALVDEEAEKAAQVPPVPSVDVPERLGRPHRLVRVTREALGRSRTVVDTRGKPEVIPCTCHIRWAIGPRGSCTRF